MRSILLVLACLVTTAWAKPKVAVVPLADDLPGGKLGTAVSEALADDFTVTSFKALGKVTKETGELDDDAVAKVEKQLGVGAVVHGAVVKEGKKRSLRLKISRRGAGARTVTVRLVGTALDDDGKAKIRDAVARQLADREPTTTKVRKRRHRRGGGGDDDEPEQKRASQDVFAAAGAAFGMRRLTYDTTAPKRPPTVSTGAPSGRIAAELYGKAAGASGALGDLGIAGEYDLTLGLTIALGAIKVPIDQAHYAIGLRYRIAAGAASVVVLGADYAARHYIADRSKLTPGTPLDAPDTDYRGAQLDVGGRTPFTPAITGFAALSAMLPFDAGGIQKTDSYGPANVYGVGLTAGVDVALTAQIALRIAGEAEQIGLSFKGTGNLAQARMVTAATDRQLGIVAMLALVY